MTYKKANFEIEIEYDDECVDFGIDGEDIFGAISDNFSIISMSVEEISK